MPSSVISALRYDGPSRTLTVIYRHGKGVYRYFDVSEETWQAFQAADSKGTYLNVVFKHLGHRYEKVTRRAKP